MKDPYDLKRFVPAQEPVFGQVCAELTAGRKESHWMWFIFPQLRGLGSSATAERYAIGSLEEARAYLDHALLGERLRRCTALVNRVEGRTAQAIFGYPDYLKFRSCMTLFAHAAEEPGQRAAAAAARSGGGDGDRLFREALVRYFAGEDDPLTLRLLRFSS
jgi:uncharacterized protein (DUF1810 family)